MAQNQYIEKPELRAAIYSGRLTESLRPFCIERNGRIFTVRKLALFDRLDDEFEWDSDKSAGRFSGKLKNSHDPFTICAVMTAGITCPGFLKSMLSGWIKV